MRYLKCTIPEKEAYIIPIGDIHLGDIAFRAKGMKLLLETLNWVKEHPNARVFILGDLFNCASRISPTSPFETDKNEYTRAADFFAPYKDKIIGAIDGNHEARMLDMFGLSPMQVFCANLGIEYCQWSAVVRFNVGHRGKIHKEGGNFGQVYHGFFHHTTGGGGTLGGKLNRVVKLNEIVEGCDFYCGGHNHQLAVAPVDKFYPCVDKGSVERRRAWYIDCGAYLEYENSYAERGMLVPTKLGSPTIKLGGNHHVREVNVNL